MPYSKTDTTILAVVLLAVMMTMSVMLQVASAFTYITSSWNSPPTPPPNPRNPLYVESTIVLLNRIWAQVVAEVDPFPNPTQGSRLLGMYFTAIYNAWAVYDCKARGTVPEANNIAPPPVSGELRPEQRQAQFRRNRDASMSFAALQILFDYYPDPQQQVQIKRQFEKLFIELGLDEDLANNSTDPGNAVGIGNRIARAIINEHFHDGSNAKGEENNGGDSFSDYTNWSERNDLYHLNNSNNNYAQRPRSLKNWAPLVVPIDSNYTEYWNQSYLSVQWAALKPFSMTHPSQFRPPAPPQYGSPEWYNEYIEIMNISTKLTEEMKVIAMYWFREGPKSVSPPGQLMQLAQWVSWRDNHTLDQDAKLFFILANTMYDVGIAAWEAKRFYDTARPITVIRDLFANKQVLAWRKCSTTGPVQIDGSEWLPFHFDDFVTPPFSGYVSGHSTFAAAWAEVLQRFTGSDEFGLVEPILPGTSPIEPPSNCNNDGAMFPKTKVVLQYPTFSSAAQDAAISRLYSGVHTRSDYAQGMVLGRQVASVAYPKALEFINEGGACKPFVVRSSNPSCASLC